VRDEAAAGYYRPSLKTSIAAILEISAGRYEVAEKLLDED